MTTMMINRIKQEMARFLTGEQLRQLQTVLEKIDSEEQSEETKTDLVTAFLSAKRVEGCSDKTVRYYDSTIRKVLSSLNKDAGTITTDDLRRYLDNYQQKSGASKVTIDNIRRIL